MQKLFRRKSYIDNLAYPNTLLRVIKKMDQLGFRIWDFTDLNRTADAGILWLVEAVFVLKGSRIDEASQSVDWLTIEKAQTL
jgi:hypothetical protein